MASSLEGAQACTIGVYSFGPGQQICLPALTPANTCECTLLNPACELLRPFLTPCLIGLARWIAPPLPVSLVSASDSGPLVQRVDGACRRITLEERKPMMNECDPRMFQYQDLQYVYGQGRKVVEIYTFISII